MNISKYHSSKITILNSVLIMMVLYIHSYYLEGEKYRAALALQHFLGAFCGTANHLFFFLSGLLFFNGITQIKDCIAKIKKRVRNLLIPYLIWNVVFVLWYVALNCIPGVKGFINSNILGHFETTIWESLCFLWIAPASFPLWFLRDLMVMVGLSPIIYLFIKYLKIYGIMFYMLLSLFLPNSGMFFILGAAVAMLSDLDRLEKWLNVPLVICCIVVFLGGCLFIAFQSKEYKVSTVLTFVMGITGMIATWRSYDFIAKGKFLKQGSLWAGLMGIVSSSTCFMNPHSISSRKFPSGCWETLRLP